MRCNHAYWMSVVLAGAALTSACDRRHPQDDDDIVIHDNDNDDIVIRGDGQHGSSSTGSSSSGSSSSGGGSWDAGDGKVDDDTRVTIEQGDVEGQLLDGNVRAFLGIPYADAPTGDLRWKQARKPGKWSYVLQAKDYGSRCPQPESAVLMNAASDTEDCLYLNVWTPEHKASRKLPVLFWIHGGGNVNGSASEPVPYVKSGHFYEGANLAKNKEVVVVSLNYRLGVLGFLANPDLKLEKSASGNQGLWDQQVALQWVRDNIAAFGGDPKNVTIFGESAGALDVCLHVASPKSRGLFHSAISESGGCTTYQPTAADAEANSAKLAAQLGCTGSDTIGCMRKRSVKELFDAVTATGVSFGPNVDGDLFPVQPRALFDAQNIAQVPYILGTNTDEGTLFTTAYASIDNEDDYHAVLKKNFTASIEDICEAYSLDQFKDSPNKYQASLARIFGDARLVCPTYDTAVRASNAGSNVWLYNFDIPANMGNLGATHGSELVYVFGTGPSLNAVQRDVSDLIQSYWSNLAKFGNPNDTALYAWPKFSEKDNVRVNLGLDATIAKDFRAPECEFWRKEYDKRFVAAAPATPN